MGSTDDRILNDHRCVLHSQSTHVEDSSSSINEENGGRDGDWVLFAHAIGSACEYHHGQHLRTKMHA